MQKTLPAHKYLFNGKTKKVREIWLEKSLKSVSTVDFEYVFFYHVVNLIIKHVLKVNLKPVLTYVSMNEKPL